MEIDQAVEKFNSISREQLNFQIWPILCTTLYRNPIPAINFGALFDQIFLWIFYATFTEDGPLLFLYHGAKKKSKLTKNSNQGRGLPWGKQQGRRACNKWIFTWNLAHILIVFMTAKTLLEIFKFSPSTFAVSSLKKQAVLGKTPWGYYSQPWSLLVVFFFWKLLGKKEIEHHFWALALIT